MARTGRPTTLFSLVWYAHPVRASTMATGLSSMITSLIAGWSAISPFLEPFRGQDHSINALPFPKRATLSVAVGFCTPSSMIQPIRRGSVITQSSRFGTAVGALPKMPTTSRSTSLTGRRLPSKGCAFLLSTARQCSRVVLLMRLLLTSRLLAWATPTVWYQLVFAPVTHHLRAEMNFYYLLTALLPAA